MAANGTEIEYDVDKDIVIDESNLEQLNFFTSTEIVPDGLITADDILQSTGIELSKKPKIIANNEDRSIHNYFSDTLLEISKYSHAVESGLLFHLCERVIKEIISTNVKKKEIATKETLSISKEEKQIPYYVSGYIIFSMVEKYKRIINNNEKKCCCKRCLEIFKFLESNMF